MQQRVGNCPICFDVLASGLKVTPCGHVYHSECIERWIHINSCCPSCKKRVTSRTLIKLFLEPLEICKYLIAADKVPSIDDPDDNVSRILYEKEVEQCGLLKARLSLVEKETASLKQELSAQKKQKIESEEVLLAWKTENRKITSRNKELGSEVQELRQLKKEHLRLKELERTFQFFKDVQSDEISADEVLAKHPSNNKNEKLSWLTKEYKTLSKKLGTQSIQLQREMDSHKTSRTEILQLRTERNSWKRHAEKTEQLAKKEKAAATASSGEAGRIWKEKAKKYQKSYHDNYTKRKQLEKELAELKKNMAPSESISIAGETEATSGGLKRKITHLKDQPRAKRFALEGELSDVEHPVLSHPSNSVVANSTHEEQLTFSETEDSTSIQTPNYSKMVEKSRRTQAVQAAPTATSTGQSDNIFRIDPHMDPYTFHHYNTGVPGFRSFISSYPVMLPRKAPEGKSKRIEMTGSRFFNPRASKVKKRVPSKKAAMKPSRNFKLTQFFVRK